MPVSGKVCPSLGSHFWTSTKNVICPSGRISLDKTLYLSGGPIWVGGGRCLPFGWKFQSKTDITIRFGASSRHSTTHPALPMMKTMTSLLGNDDSVFFYFWEKAGNIRGYRCYPGGRKELLVVHLVVLQQQHCWSTVRNSCWCPVPST